MPEQRERARLRSLGVVTLRKARFVGLRIPIADYLLIGANGCVVACARRLTIMDNHV